MSFASVLTALVLFEGRASQAMSISKRCYSVNATAAYSIPGGFTENQGQVRLKYDVFIQTVQTQIPAGCDGVTLTLGQLSTTPPGDSSVKVIAEMIFTAGASISDNQVNQALLTCVQTVKGLESTLPVLAPTLTDGSGTARPASSVVISGQQSCCGDDPPPCTVLVTSLLSPVSTQDYSTTPTPNLPDNNTGVVSVLQTPSPSMSGGADQTISISKRCYSVNATAAYSIPGGFTDSQGQVRLKYDLFIQTVQTQISAGCNGVTLSLEEISTTPPEDSSVQVVAEILFTADASISDNQVNQALLTCIQTVKGFEASLPAIAPKLFDENGAQNSASSVAISGQQSCCGDDPPPCTVLVTLSIGPTSTQGHSSTFFVAQTPSPNVPGFSRSVSATPGTSIPGGGGPTNVVRKRCYSVNATTLYTIPGGFTDSQEQVRLKYELFLQAVQGQLPTCTGVTLNLEEISTTPLGDSSVQVVAEILFTADDSISDNQVDSTLLTCIQSVKGLQASIHMVAPTLTDGSGTPHPATSVVISGQQSCCGDDPPPCTVLVTSPIGPTSTQDFSRSVSVTPSPTTSIPGGEKLMLRCYRLDAIASYTIPGGFTDSQVQVRLKYELFLQAVQGQLPGCTGVTLSLDEISTTPPGNSSVQVVAQILFTAEDSISDNQVDPALHACIQSVRGLQGSIQIVAPQLTDGSGTPHPADSVVISAEQSCCGDDPPPCTVLVTSPTVPFRTLVYSSFALTTNPSIRDSSKSASVMPTPQTSIPENPWQVFTIVKRCYTVPAVVVYVIPGGVSSLTEDFIRATYEPLLQTAKAFVPSCSSVTFSLKKITFTPPGQSNVRINMSIFVAADSSIPEAQIATILPSCIGTIQSSQGSLLPFVPRLSGDDGSTHAATSFAIGDEESCCGADPPPCTVMVSSFIGTLRTVEGPSSTPVMMKTPSLPPSGFSSSPVVMGTSSLSSSDNPWQVFTIVKKCYTVAVVISYNIPGGVSSLTENNVRTTYEPLLQQAKGFVPSCSSATFSLEQITFTPPGESNVRIDGSILVTADNSISDAEIASRLSSCIATIKSLQFLLAQFTPKLVGDDGVSYPATSITIGNEESCCGADPPPCTVMVSSFIGTLRTAEGSSSSPVMMETSSLSTSVPVSESSRGALSSISLPGSSSSPVMMETSSLSSSVPVSVSLREASHFSGSSSSFVMMGTSSHFSSVPVSESSRAASSSFSVPGSSSSPVMMEISSISSSSGSSSSPVMLETSSISNSGSSSSPVMMEATSLSSQVPVSESSRAPSSSFSVQGSSSSPVMMETSRPSSSVPVRDSSTAASSSVSVSGSSSTPVMIVPSSVSSSDNPWQVFTVIKRCYTVPVVISYVIPGGVSSLTENYVRTTYEPLLQTAKSVVPSCSSASLSLEQITFTPPGQSNVRIDGSILVTADSSIPDSDIPTTLSSCIGTIKLSQPLLLQFVPTLIGDDGVSYPATSITIGDEESCCGADPPPCTVMVSSFIGTLRTEVPVSVLSRVVPSSYSAPGSLTSPVMMGTSSLSSSDASSAAVSVIGTPRPSTPDNPWQVFSIVKRCYTVAVAIFYVARGPVSSLTENYVRNTYEPLLQQAKSLVSSCNGATFSLEQITFTPPGESNVRIDGSILVTADSSIQDAEVATRLTSCIGAIKSFQTLLVQFVPGLPGDDGTTYPATSITIGDEESCCGADPLPCTVMVSSFIGTLKTEEARSSVPIDASPSRSSATVSVDSNSTPSDTSGSLANTLPLAAKVSIPVFGVILIVVLVAAIVFFWRRKKGSREKHRNGSANITNFENPTYIVDTFKYA